MWILNTTMSFRILAWIIALITFSSPTIGETESESNVSASSISVASLNVDIDGNEQFDALTDGLLVLRSMFGLNGEALISGALAGDAVYASSDQIEARIAALGYRIDIDNDGRIDALTDGLLILRYLFGLTGDVLTAGVIAEDAQRTDFREIEGYLQQVTTLGTNPSGPVFISAATFNFDENKVDLYIGDINVSNATGFSISGTDIEITEGGALVFKSSPNYETKSSYTETVTAYNSTVSSTQEITITINDLDDAPVFTSLANFYVSEPTAAADVAISVSVAANNSGSGNVYVIDGQQKKSITLVAGTKYTFSHPTYHPLKFSTTSDGTHGGGVEYTAGIDASSSGSTTITAASDTPTTLYYYCSVHRDMGGAVSIQLNQTDIGILIATDEDGDALSFSISGTDAAAISLDELSGVMKFNIIPKFTTKDQYSFIAAVSDSQTIVKKIIYIDIVASDQINITCDQEYYSQKPDPVASDSAYRYYEYSWQSNPPLCINIREPELLEDDWETKVIDGLTFAKNMLGALVPVNIFLVDQKNASTETLRQIDRELCKIRGQGGEELERCVDTSDPWGNRFPAAGIGHSHLHNGAELNYFRDVWTDTGAPIRILMHEYYHTYQNSMKFYFEDQERFGIRVNWEDEPEIYLYDVKDSVAVFPGWLEEGGADFAGWALTAKFDPSIDIVAQIIEHLREGRAVVNTAALNGDIVSLKDYEYAGYLYESSDNPNNGLTRNFGYAYTGGFMGMVYLWSLDDANYKKIIVDYYRIYAERDQANPGQGWKIAFEELFGMTMEKFYEDFDAFMLKSIEEQIAIIKTKEEWAAASLD